jgi:hypothetical protein
MKGYTAITGWVADASPAILTDLYLRSGAAPASPPSKTTIWRVLTDTDAEAFDEAVGTWLMNLAAFTTPAHGQPGYRQGGPLAGVDAGEAGWQVGQGTGCWPSSPPGRTAPRAQRRQGRRGPGHSPSP